MVRGEPLQRHPGLTGVGERQHLLLVPGAREALLALFLEAHERAQCRERAGVSGVHAARGLAEARDAVEMAIVHGEPAVRIARSDQARPRRHDTVLPKHVEELAGPRGGVRQSPAWARAAPEPPSAFDVARDRCVVGGLHRHAPPLQPASEGVGREEVATNGARAVVLGEKRPCERRQVSVHRSRAQSRAIMRTGNERFEHGLLLSALQPSWRKPSRIMPSTSTYGERPKRAQAAGDEPYFA